MKKYFTYFIITIVFGCMSIYAATIYHAKDIHYENKNINVNNVNDALNVLYDVINKGDATEDDISLGKKVIVKGKVITGTGKKENDQYQKGLEDGKVTVVKNLKVDSFESYDVDLESGKQSASIYVSTGQTGVTKNDSFNYVSVPIYINNTPDDKTALLNTITFTLSNASNNTSNGGSASSSVSYTLYDGVPSDNIVISTDTTKGTKSINLFEYQLKNNFVTLTATGSAHGRHGTVSSDGIASASASISLIKSNYLTLTY